MHMEVSVMSKGTRGRHRCSPEGCSLSAPECIKGMSGRCRGQGHTLNLVCPLPGRCLGVFSRDGTPLSKQHQLMPLKTFPCSYFFLIEAKYIGHAAHRQKGMSVALNTVMNSLYFAQEVWLCVLKCHPLKVRSK